MREDEVTDDQIQTWADEAEAGYDLAALKLRGHGHPGRGAEPQPCGNSRNTNLVNTAHYSFRVTWSAEDEEFVATCVEFPLLTWLADTPETALSGLRALMDELVTEMRNSGEDVPEQLLSSPCPWGRS